MESCNSNRTPHQSLRSRTQTGNRLPAARTKAPPPLAATIAAAASILTACSPDRAKDEPPPPADTGVICRVGSVAIYQSDLDRELQQRRAPANDPAASRRALDDLVAAAQFAAAAIEQHIEREPDIRAELSRLLASRLREKHLAPRLRELSAPVPEARLREIYHARAAQFQSPEKRQVAVLWLNPGASPDREKQYTAKLAAAREWLIQNSEIIAHPERGFSVLSVDHTEHAASRYRGGILGWIERSGSTDAWSRAVAEIAFSLKQPGDISDVTARAEGIFLVRYMAQQPPVTRSFDEVKKEIEGAERKRLRAEAEAEFERAIKAKFPPQWPAR